MSKRGRMQYVPVIILDEVDDIKREDDLESGTEAYRQLVKYARVGRELNRIKNLDWSKKVPLPDVFNNKRKKGGLI